MPVPDKHADENTIEVPEGTWAQYQYYRAKEREWKKLADGMRDALVTAMQDNGATAVLVAGAKVASYRGQANYAAARIQEDFPDLAQHFVHDELVTRFDVEMFAKMHPEIAERYRVHSFKDLS